MTKKVDNMDEKNAVVYEDALGRVKDELHRVLKKAPLLIREYTSHLMLSQGKFIRAISVITAAEEKEGTVHPDAIKLAVAIEIVHLASLVHDDVIDDADLRRGKETLQKKYGKRTAVICGDYLLSIGLRMAASCERKKEYLDFQLNDYMGRLVLGELNQHINNFNVNISIYQYLKIIAGKTAALFEASFLAGAVYASTNEKERNRYKQLGFMIGMIFQLMDDCMDFEETIEVAAKPVQSDYEQGVITLPLIHALKELHEFKAQAQAGKITRKEINAAVDQAGGLLFTKKLVQRYYDKSIQLVDKLDIHQTKKDKLITIVNKSARVS